MLEKGTEKDPVTELAQSLPAVHAASEKFGNSTIVHYAMLVLGILYFCSPVDIVPDIPIVGWFDDVTISLGTGLNVLEKGLLDTNQSFQRIVRMIKWAIIFIGVLLTLIIGGVVVGFIKLFF